MYTGKKDSLNGDEEQRAKNNRLRMQIVSEQDEIYATLKPLFLDIERIGKNGYNGTPQDLDIVKIMAKLIRCELLLRAFDADSSDQC